MEYTFSTELLDKIDTILGKELIEAGAQLVFLIDMAGNIVARCDDGDCKHDVYSLAALAAGNFAAVNAMAGLIGENEFSLLFHKGKSTSIHFTRVDEEFLLITMFGEDASLGFLRLRLTGAVNRVKKALQDSNLC